MAFIVPTFNLAGNYWRRSTWGVHLPGVIPPPDIALFPCQLRINATPFVGTVISSLFMRLDQLLVPKLTDFRFAARTSADFILETDILEVPSGSSRFYYLATINDVAKGFPNEYREALIIGSNTYDNAWADGLLGGQVTPRWPIPYP
jgi:hypothetical protein